MIPKAKTALNKKMNAMKALLAESAPVFFCTETAAVAAIQMKVMLENVPMSIGRRPSLSTKKAPTTACVWSALKSLQTKEQVAYKSQLHARLAQVDVHLLELICDTSRYQNTIEEVVDRTVTCPLTEDSNAAITSQTIAGSVVLEKRAVVPPALVTTVHVKVLLVLVDLHSNPDAVLPAGTVVFSKNLLGLGVPATSVEPARRLRKKPRQAKNQSREENLHPDGYDPAHVAFKSDRATSNASSKKRADEPIMGSVKLIFNVERLLTRMCCKDQ